jgi:hypothetical protein
VAPHPLIRPCLPSWHLTLCSSSLRTLLLGTSDTYMISTVRRFPRSFAGTSGPTRPGRPYGRVPDERRQGRPFLPAILYTSSQSVHADSGRHGTFPLIPSVGLDGFPGCYVHIPCNFSPRLPICSHCLLSAAEHVRRHSADQILRRPESCRPHRILSPRRTLLRSEVVL